jgi:hypothetical protein
MLQGWTCSLFRLSQYPESQSHLSIYAKTSSTYTKNLGQQSSKHIVKHRQTTWSKLVKKTWSTIVKAHGQTLSKDILKHRGKTESKIVDKTWSNIIKTHRRKSSKHIVKHCQNTLSTIVKNMVNNRQKTWSQEQYRGYHHHIRVMISMNSCACAACVATKQSAALRVHVDMRCQNVVVSYP